MPLIASVTIPTFTRPYSKLTAFNRLVPQLEDTASDPDDIEILVKIDDGDTQAFDQCSKYAEQYPNFHFWVTPSLGYRGINTYHDFLAPKSKGQFILISADDNIMESKGWDKMLYNYIDKTTWFLKPFHGQPTKGNLSQIMHRHLYDLVGHTGRYPTDWFWDNIHMTYPIQWDTPEIRYLHSWTGFNEENATDEIQGPLTLDHGEVGRIIEIVERERNK